MKNRLFLIGLIVLPMMVRAQHNLELGLRGGVAGWSSGTNYVAGTPGLHAGIEAAYTFRSPYVVGFRIGLTADRHACGFGKAGYEDSYQTIDVENEVMQVDYTIGQLNEQYTIWSVGIPLQLVFAWEQVRLALGPKVVCPLSCTWSEHVRNAELSVYYPLYDNRVYEAYPLAASRNFSMDNDGTLQLPKVQVWGALEGCYTIPLDNDSRKFSSSIVVGVYVDYCFTRYTPDRSDAISLIMLTDTRDGFPLQRVLTPVMIANRQGRPLVANCALFDAGIKIAYAFSSSTSSRRTSQSCHCFGVW